VVSSWVKPQAAGPDGQPPSSPQAGLGSGHWRVVVVAKCAHPSRNLRRRRGGRTLKPAKVEGGSHGAIAGAYKWGNEARSGGRGWRAQASAFLILRPSFASVQRSSKTVLGGVLIVQFSRRSFVHSKGKANI